MGDTALDEETLTEYIDGIRDHYTADKVSLGLAIDHALTDEVSVPFIRHVIIMQKCAQQGPYSQLLDRFQLQLIHQ